MNVPARWGREVAVVSYKYLYTKNTPFGDHDVNISYNSVNVLRNLPIQIQFLCIVINQRPNRGNYHIISACTAIPGYHHEDISL